VRCSGRSELLFEVSKSASLFGGDELLPIVRCEVPKVNHLFCKQHRYVMLLRMRVHNRMLQLTPLQLALEAARDEFGVEEKFVGDAEVEDGESVLRPQFFFAAASVAFPQIRRY